MVRDMAARLGESVTWLTVTNRKWYREVGKSVERIASWPIVTYVEKEKRHSTSQKRGHI